MNTETTDLVLSVAGKGEVSALCLKPVGCQFFLVLGHGAGAGMRHPFLELLAETLAERGIGTLRYQFAYMDRGLRKPDLPHVLQSTVRAAVNSAGLIVRDVPLFAGGKSMGGRMTSLAQSQKPLHGVRGIVFYGFPLHPTGDPGITRAEHLARVNVPLLFLQGTRDRLAIRSLLEPVLAGLGRQATVQWLAEGDHDFSVPKRTGMDGPAVMAWLADHTLAWMQAVVATY